MLSKTALPFPTNLIVSETTNMQTSSGVEPLTEEHLTEAEDLLRRGLFNPALMKLSRIPHQSLTVYAEYVKWANLAIQAYILSGRYAVWPSLV